MRQTCRDAFFSPANLRFMGYNNPFVLQATSADDLSDELATPGSLLLVIFRFVAHMLSKRSWSCIRYSTSYPGRSVMNDGTPSLYQFRQTRLGFWGPARILTGPLGELTGPSHPQNGVWQIRAVPRTRGLRPHVFGPARIGRTPFW